jgi:hypothetical protein
MQTVIHDNINPIERFEATQLCILANLHACKPLDIVDQEQRERISGVTPMLVKM